MSQKFFISYSALNVSGIFWKMTKFENLITQRIKSMFEHKNKSFPFTLSMSYWEITLSVNR